MLGVVYCLLRGNQPTGAAAGAAVAAAGSEVRDVVVAFSSTSSNDR